MINTVAQVGEGCWAATGLSWWMGFSDPQGPGRGRESINPAKMKLCPGCHNPFASSRYCPARGKFVLKTWLFDLSDLCRPALDRQKLQNCDEQQYCHSYIAGQPIVSYRYGIDKGLSRPAMSNPNG